MTIECALKALWLKQGRKYAFPGKGFLQGLKLSLAPMGGASKHNLRAMAVAVGMSDKGELELVEHLSWFVEWAGRYPVPLIAEKMLPKEQQYSGTVIPHVITPEKLENATRLAERLIEEAKPWKR
jgi:hypothetical protein